MKEPAIDYVLRATWQAVARMYNEQAATYGGSMAIGFVLLNIDRENGTPSTMLAPQMGMEPTSLSRTLKSMEEKGLIIRRPNPDDGRGVLIYLTDFGKQMRERSRETVIIFNEAVRAKVSDEKIAHFYEVADAVNKLVADREIYNQKQL